MNLAGQKHLHATMIRILFIQPDGREQSVESKPGQSVMQAAIGAMVPGIVADCGGACACATCHGYVDSAWTEHIPPASTDEADMIDAACLDVQPNSRLTCQIKLTPEMAGLVIRIPPAQA
jgi:2Fe-2S ferredoxin